MQKGEKGQRRGSGRIAAYFAVLCVVGASLPEGRYSVTPIPALAQPRNATTWTHLPLSFVPNRGQWNAHILFAAQGPGYAIGLMARGMQFRVASPTGQAAAGRHNSLPQSTIVRFELAGARGTSALDGHDRLPGHASYFLGNDPGRWRTGLPTYAEVRYRGVYPGIDLSITGTTGALEYTWQVQPHASLSSISWRVYGAHTLRLDREGSLHVGIASGEIVEGKPLLFQPMGSGRRIVAGGYTLLGGNRIGLKTAEPYNQKAPLVVDPTVSYATRLGGAKSDVGLGIGVDKDNNTYITGSTQSEDFPAVHALQRGKAHDLNLFVAKLNPSGTQLLYSTFLSGTHTISGTPGVDEGLAIAVDGAGDAYVTGDTDTVDYPTIHAAQRANRSQCTLYGLPVPCEDAIVSKLSPNGTSLLYSTYIGGDTSDIAQGIAIDGSGSAYVTGKTDSTDFPAVHAIQPLQKGVLCPDDLGQAEPCVSAFVTKLSASGSKFVYSTYLGGTGNSIGNGIDVDSRGRAMISGDTMAVDFPVVHPVQKKIPGPHVGFVSLLNPAGDSLVFSSYLGGAQFDVALNIAAGRDGSMYVTGLTDSPNFPLVKAFQSASHGSDAFVSRIAPSGTLLYSTYLGGSEGQDGFGIAVDGAGNAWVSGDTGSSDFPLAHAVQTKLKGETNAYLSEFDPAGRLLYSSYLGGSGLDAGLAITLGKCGWPYITGSTTSQDFPGTHLGGTGSGDGDIFVTRLSTSGGCIPSGHSTPTLPPTASPPAATRATPTAISSGQPAQKCKKGFKRTAGKCRKVKPHR